MWKNEGPPSQNVRGVTSSADASFNTDNPCPKSRSPKLDKSPLEDEDIYVDLTPDRNYSTLTSDGVKCVESAVWRPGTPGRNA